MKRLFFYIVSFGFAFNSNSQTTTKRLLVFSKTTKYYHTSVTAGMQAVVHLGNKNGFTVDTTRDAAVFNYDYLKRYNAVMFLSPGGNILDSNQQEAFKNFIQSGGGFIGVHAATTAEYDWPWYASLVGGVFDGHPESQKGVVVRIDSLHPSTQHLPNRWQRYDEWYNFKNLRPDIHVLLGVDESTYTGGKHGAFHPLAWYHELEGGRSFYTALGHYADAYTEPLFLQHLLAGICYVMQIDPEPGKTSAAVSTAESNH